MYHKGRTARHRTVPLASHRSADAPGPRRLSLLSPDPPSRLRRRGARAPGIRTRMVSPDRVQGGILSSGPRAVRFWLSAIHADRSCTGNSNVKDRTRSSPPQRGGRAEAAAAAYSPSSAIWSSVMVADFSDSRTRSRSARSSSSYSKSFPSRMAPSRCMDV